MLQAFGARCAAPRARQLNPTPGSAPGARRNGPKTRKREARRRAAAELALLDSKEAQRLESELGIAPADLPLHLRVYGVQASPCLSWQLWAGGP